MLITLSTCLSDRHFFLLTNGHGSFCWPHSRVHAKMRGALLCSDPVRLVSGASGHVEAASSPWPRHDSSVNVYMAITAMSVVETVATCEPLPPSMVYSTSAWEQQRQSAAIHCQALAPLQSNLSSFVSQRHATHASPNPPTRATTIPFFWQKNTSKTVLMQ